MLKSAKFLLPIPEIHKTPTFGPDFSYLILLLYIELSNSFLIGRKRTVNFRNQRSWRHNCRWYNSHVKCARFVLLPVRTREEAQTWLPFCFLSMFNKTIIRFGLCDIQNNQGLGKSYQPQASANNPYLDLDYSGYHKNLIQ